ncbi:hypothetical protein PTKIN_Ptkin11bG0121700 [Pterospermum kingtungense]
MMWKENVDMKIQGFSKHHIDAEITEQNGRQWRLTGIYDEPNMNLRSHTWSLLRTVARDNSLPWLCLGDFNELIWSSEKEGGRMRPEWQMKAFREALKDAQLEDLGFSGHQFTWKRGRSKKNLVKERLDRATANNERRCLFQNYKVTHLDYLLSDHSILFVSFVGCKQKFILSKKMRRRRFEPMWVREEEAKQIIQNTWQCITNDVLTKVDKTHRNLQQWS